MRILRRISVISLFTGGKSHISVPCTQGLRTCLNQSRVQVPCQAVNEHRESWFHVFVLLEEAVWEHCSTLSLWEAVLCSPLWTHALHIQILAGIWHSPDHTRVTSISCPGLAERLQPFRAVQQQRQGQTRYLWLSGRELKSCFILLDPLILQVAVAQTK